MYFYHETPFEALYGPLYRFISDLAEDDYILACMDVGVEANTLSNHKTD